MGKYAATFDADLIDTVYLQQALECATEIEKMAAAMKAELAVRLADTERWRRDGDRSPAHQLARVTGSSLGSAIDALHTARRLRDLPTIAEAARRGRLSPQQTSAIADAAGDPFLAAIATKGEQVVGVAHLGRAPTALQHSALEWLYPSCAREDCHQAVRLERDHRVPWADSKVTIADLMDRLCHHDHELKTIHGWELVEGRGKRAFVPPTDPRHPRYRPPPIE
jgi:hypothetical protein